MKKILMLACIPLAVACSSGHQEEQASQAHEVPGPPVPVALRPLYDSVLAIHDNSAMPLMDPIMSSKMKIKGLYDSAQSISEEDMVLLSQLEAANDSMMEWMHNFEAKYDGWPEDSVREYLQSEYARIYRIDEQMKAAVAKAKARLAQ